MYEYSTRALACHAGLVIVRCGCSVQGFRLAQQIWTCFLCTGGPGYSGQEARSPNRE